MQPLDPRPISKSRRIWRRAIFEGAPHEWRVWVASLGHVRRAAFFPLPGNVVRFEVASEMDGKLQLPGRACGGMNRANSLP